MKTVLSESESHTLGIVTFLATFLVVLRHGFNLHRFYAGGWQGMPILDFNVFFQCFISEFSSLAVPTFFFVSGFLFFLTLDDLQDILKKLKRRISSLLLPYFCWNILYLLIILPVAFSPIGRTQMIHTYSFEWTYQWFLQRLTVHPIVGQFWYIRTLIIFCAFTPLLYWIYQRKLLSLVMLGILFSHWSPVDCGIFSKEGQFFFYLGGLIGFHKLHSLLFENHSELGLLAIFIVGAIILDITHCRQLVFRWPIRIIISVVFLFQFASWLSARNTLGRWIIKCSSYSFTLYALHAVLLSSCNEFASRLLPHTAWISFSVYWFSIVFVCIFVICVQNFMISHCHFAYRLLNGGR